MEELDELVGPDGLVLVESGGDNLTATFSYGLVDRQIFVVDVAGGDKVPRKGGPGITQSDLLVKELLEVSERGQRQIGHDLHDSLGQHLTATAFACQDLAEQLEGRPVQAAAAGHLVKMVEEAIPLSRTFARGLIPFETDAEGLMSGFEELAGNISRQFKIDCQFECPHPVLLRDTTVCLHLYRIAQEAVTNAIKHGKARRVTISLAADAETIYLEITDDGAGLPAHPNSGGLGLQIMAHRAGMIGGDFKIEPLPGQGARVTCTLPASGVAAPENHG